jgi:hypothetical protein
MVKFWSLTVKLPVAEIDKRATTGFGEGVVRAVGLGLGELVPSGLVAGDGLRSAVARGRGESQTCGNETPNRSRRCDRRPHWSEES